MEHTIYLVLACVGGGILLLQVLLQVFGLAGHGDFDGSHDGGNVGADGGAHDGSWFFGVLSFKALVAFAGLFGLTGLALYDTDWSSGARIAVATLVGFVGMLLVAFLMRSLLRLSSSGSLDPRNAVGTAGAVYLRVPAYGRGAGKVTLEIQGRSLQLEAVTDGEEIPTGARVKVVGLVGEETLKVMPA